MDLYLVLVYCFGQALARKLVDSLKYLCSVESHKTKLSSYGVFLAFKFYNLGEKEHYTRNFLQIY